VGLTDWCSTVGPVNQDAPSSKKRSAEPRPIGRVSHVWSVGRLARWKRRAVTMPGVFLATVVVVTLSPLLALMALLVDLKEGWKNKRWLRILGFLLLFLILETSTLVVMFFAWIITGFGLFMEAGWSQRMHFFIEKHWILGLQNSVLKPMGGKLHIDGEDLLTPGPIIVIGRHVSMGDAALPGMILANRNNLQIRYIAKEDLVWVPVLDIVGHRLPHWFVNRKPDDRVAELESISNLAAGLGTDGAGVIFPEGTFRTNKRFDRVLEKLRTSDPSRAAAVSQLQHLLPARPSGTLAMLEGNLDADVVFMTHVGFERFISFAEIIKTVPFDRPIEIKVWRHKRADVPTDPTEQLAWLDHHWQVSDDWIHETMAGPHRSTASAD